MKKPNAMNTLGYVIQGEFVGLWCNRLKRLILGAFGGRVRLHFAHRQLDAATLAGAELLAPANADSLGKRGRYGGFVGG